MAMRHASGKRDAVGAARSEPSVRRRAAWRSVRVVGLTVTLALHALVVLALVNVMKPAGRLPEGRSAAVPIRILSGPARPAEFLHESASLPDKLTFAKMLPPNEHALPLHILRIETQSDTAPNLPVVAQVTSRVTSLSPLLRKKQVDDKDDIVTGYARKVWDHVARFRPRGIRLRGTAMISVTIGPHGELESLSLARSSGSGRLDALAIETVGKATPFPRPPPELTTEDSRFVIPFRFL